MMHMLETCVVKKTVIYGIGSVLVTGQVHKGYHGA